MTRPDDEVVDVLLLDELGELVGVLAAARRQVGIAADALLEVHLALAVSRQVDGARQHAYVHEEVDDARLYVADDAVDEEAFAHVEYLDERVVLLHLLVDGLVAHLVEANALEEVAHGLVAVHVLVVGRAHFHLAYVGLDHLGVVAYALDEEEAEAVALRAVVVDHLTALTGRVRRVEDGHLAVVVQPAAHVLQGTACAVVAYVDELLVGRIEDLLARVVRQRLASVLAHVEELRLHAYPVQVARQLARYVRLAARRQAHHADHRRRLHQFVTTR